MSNVISHDDFPYNSFIITANSLFLLPSSVARESRVMYLASGGGASREKRRRPENPSSFTFKICIILLSLCACYLRKKLKMLAVYNNNNNLFEKQQNEWLVPLIVKN